MSENAIGYGEFSIFVNSRMVIERADGEGKG